MMEPATDEVVKEMGRAKDIVCSRQNEKKCGRCDVVSYCSRECQDRDWKRHKSVVSCCEVAWGIRVRKFLDLDKTCAFVFSEGSVAA